MSNVKNPIRIIKTDFRAGEVDPTFLMRVDARAYPSGSKSLRNMLLASTGAASRRPGTLALAVLNQRSRLLEFEFDVNEKYVCAFSNTRLDIYNPDGTLAQTFTGCPWTTTTVWELTVEQRFDVMLVAHTDFMVRRVRRTGLTTFVLETVGFSTDSGAKIYNQPFRKYYPDDYTLEVDDAHGGAGRTVTCNQPIFSAAWVGDRIRILGKELQVTAYVSPTVVTATLHQSIRPDLDPAPFRYTDGSNVVEVTHVLHGMATGAGIFIGGATDAFGISKGNINGARTITVMDEDHYQVTAGANATDSGDGGGPSVTVLCEGPTRTWTEKVWSDRRGWPGCICLHEGRLWLGGSRSAPTFLSGSAVGDYYDHNVRDGLDDDSVQADLSTLSRIRHLVSARQMQLFTETTEAIIETQNGQPITPGTFKAVTYTRYGSGNVRPRPFDGATLFAQRNGKNIREVAYDFNTDSQTAAPVSIIAGHMINTPRDVATLVGTPTRPEQYAFFVNSDGTIACFHSIRSEELTAWTPLVIGSDDGQAKFDSVCVIGYSVYVSVLRGAAYHLERLELDATDVWLDGAVKMSGASSTSWNLGSRFSDRTVSVMSNGHLIAVVRANSSGVITLPVAVTSIVAGYDYGVEMIPNPPDRELADGPVTGVIRRIVSSNIHFHKSVSAAVNGHELLAFTIGDDPSLPPPQVTGKKIIRMLGYGTDPSLTLTQPEPGPLTVLGMNMEVSL